VTAKIGDRIGDYEIVGVLGAGGMGRVYKARNVISDRIEAIKVLLPELVNVPELADRFMREIKVLAGLEHPNIAALRTAQRVDNQIIMVMELVEGVTLEDCLDKGPVPVPEALGYISQVLSALSYAHARGVIHRDIKPANMMVTAGGVVKLMDFGIAKAAGERKLTMTGTTLGSLFYMSPEQIRGKDLDSRSDLYSLGVALYEIVTKSRPFQGDSDFSIMSAHLEKEPVPPIQVDPKLPAELNEIILMAIGREPEQRFQTADAMRAAIDSIRGVTAAPTHAVTAAAIAAAAAPPPRPSTLAAAAVPRSGHRGLYMAMGALVLIAVIVLGATLIPKWLGTRAGSSQLPAEQQAVPATPTEQPVVQPPIEQPPAEQPPPPQPQAQTVVPQQRPATARPATGGNAPQTAQPLGQQRAPSQTPPNQASPAPAVDQAKAAALKELQKNWPMLDSRAAAVDGSLQNLQQQQARSGLGLRGDISASWRRMQTYMRQTEDALASKDPDAAKENMDNVERELGLLEKFLGR
jgi:serine/threonine-protein kinase